MKIIVLRKGLISVTFNSNGKYGVMDIDIKEIFEDPYDPDIECELRFSIPSYPSTWNHNKSGDIGFIYIDGLDGLCLDTSILLCEIDSSKIFDAKVYRHQKNVIVDII